VLKYAFPIKEVLLRNSRKETWTRYVCMLWLTDRVYSTGRLYWKCIRAFLIWFSKARLVNVVHGPVESW